MANSGLSILCLLFLTLLVGNTGFSSPANAQSGIAGSGDKHKFTNILPDRQTTYVGVSGPEVEVNIEVIEGDGDASSFPHPPGPHSGIPINPASGPLKLRKPDGVTTLMRSKQKVSPQKQAAQEPAKKPALVKPAATAARPTEETVKKPVSKPVEQPVSKPVEQPVSAPVVKPASKPAPTPAPKIEKETAKIAVPAPPPPVIPEVPAPAIESSSAAASPPPPPPVAPKSAVERAEPPKIAAPKKAPAEKPVAKKQSGPKDILPPKLAPKLATKPATESTGDQADTKVAKVTTESPVNESGQLSIRFDSGSTALTLEATEQLKSLAASLASNDERLQLMAYADEEEPGASTARRQSLRRALTARSFLIKQGILSTRIDVRAMGQPESGFPDRIDIINIR